jgi:hypothetical protein
LKIDNVLDQLISEEDQASLIEEPAFFEKPIEDDNEMYEYGEEVPNMFETEEEKLREK